MREIKKTIVTVIRWSEGYIRTDMLYLTIGGFWLGLGQVSSTLASLATSIAFANLLPPETYGLYRYALSVMAILSIPTLSGINTALMRSAARSMDGSLLVAFKTRLSWGTLGMTAGFATAAYYLINGNHSLAIIFFVVSVFIPIFYSLEIYSSFLKGKRQFKQSTLLMAIAVVISSTSLVIALLYTDNVSFLLISYFLPYTLLRGIFLYHTVRSFAKSQQVDPRMTSYGKHLSVMSALITVANEIDKLLLWHLLGPAQVAAYTIALAPVRNVEALKSHLNTLALPKIAGLEMTHIQKVTHRKTLTLFLVLFLITALYIFAAPTLYHYVFPQYESSVRYSQVVALSILFPGTFLSATFTAYAKIKEQYATNLLYSAGKIIISVAFIPAFGMWGAVISYVVAYGATFVLQMILFNRMKANTTT